MAACNGNHIRCTFSHKQRLNIILWLIKYSFVFNIKLYSRWEILMKHTERWICSWKVYPTLDLLLHLPTECLKGNTIKKNTISNYTNLNQSKKIQKSVHTINSLDVSSHNIPWPGTKSTGLWATSTQCSHVWWLILMTLKRKN